MANVLYISLTGMTEPLGRSQVLEYLMDLSHQHKIFLISFERQDDLTRVGEIEALLKEYDIEWHYLVYSNKYGVLSTLNQLRKAVSLGAKLIKENSIDIVHARSMIPATMGLILKKMYGVKLLFDIRGFAIDEKVDSGRLKKNAPLFKILKKLDNYLYKTSDHIVTLTYAAKMILEERLLINEEKISVIPTCASKDVFCVLEEDEKSTFKEALGYDEKAKIIIHTGTVSGWYDFESEVKLVKEMMVQDERVHFLVLNKHEQSFIQEIVTKFKLPEERVKVSSCAFDEVYKYLNIADASLFFIKPSYSKQASAPTKFAENVACFLPSITNTDVGDMGFYLEQYSVGTVVDLETLDEQLEAVAQSIIAQMNKQDVDEDEYTKLFDKHFDKEMAVQKYDAIYEKLEKC